MSSLEKHEFYSVVDAHIYIYEYGMIIISTVITIILISSTIDYHCVHYYPYLISVYKIIAIIYKCMCMYDGFNPI